MSTKILVVDDEVSIVEILKYNLELEGYIVDTASSGAEALSKKLEDFSLFFFDIMLDDMSGYELAKRVLERDNLRQIPIIFCSALSGEDERVRGLNIGGDDYITKPFRIRELIARTRSVLRRVEISRTVISESVAAYRGPSEIHFKDLLIDVKSRLCKIGGVPVKLTKTEFELAYFFFSHQDNIYPRKEIVSNIWGTEGDVSARAIDTNITRLRKKLGQYGRYITTRMGYGYGFEDK